MLQSVRTDDSKTRTSELWEQYRHSRSAEVRNRLVSRYFHLVKGTAERMAMEVPDRVDHNELIGAGVMGLMQAIEKFDRRQKVKFETYCTPRIRGAILDELRDLDWMSRPLRAKAQKARDVSSALAHTFGRLPSDHEVAASLGLTSWEYTVITRHASSPAACLHANVAINASGDELRIIDFLRDERASNPADIIEKRETCHVVASLIRSLPSADRLVILLYYYDRLTMKQIGHILSISESRICQMHSEVITKLQRRLSSQKEDLVAQGK